MEKLLFLFNVSVSVAWRRRLGLVRRRRKEILMPQFQLIPAASINGYSLDTGSLTDAASWFECRISIIVSYALRLREESAAWWRGSLPTSSVWCAICGQAVKTWRTWSDGLTRPIASLCLSHPPVDGIERWMRQLFSMTRSRSSLSKPSIVALAMDATIDENTSSFEMNHLPKSFSSFCFPYCIKIRIHFKKWPWFAPLKWDWTSCWLPNLIIPAVKSTAKFTKWQFISCPEDCNFNNRSAIFMRLGRFIGDAFLRMKARLDSKTLAVASHPRWLISFLSMFVMKRGRSTISLLSLFSRSAIQLSTSRAISSSLNVGFLMLFAIQRMK